MKRVFIILMLFVVTTLSGGCGVIFKEFSDNSDGSQSEKVLKSTAPQIMFDKIIFALDNRDSEALKSLFATNALIKTEDIDNQITELIELYKGKFVSNSPFDSGSSSGHKEFATWTYLVIGPNIRELKTDEAAYSMIFNAVSVDDENPDDVGLWRIMLWFDTEEKREKEKNFEYVIPDCIVGYDYEGRANELDEQQKWAVQIVPPDYWNMGAGTEIGLYEYAYYHEVSRTDHYDVVDYELPMTLYLYTEKSGSYENVFAWEPSINQWWITGFDPEYQSPNSNDLATIGTVQFIGREDSRGMYEALKADMKLSKNKLISHLLIFDEDEQMAWVIWE